MFYSLCNLHRQYIGAFGELAKAGNTLIMPANAADPSAMISQVRAREREKERERERE